MSEDYKFFSKPFAIQGDIAEVPDEMQTDGSVSFESGWGYDYERNPETDNLAKDIGRPEMNYLLRVITEQIRQYQTEGTFYYITPEKNGGNPYPYRSAARCLFEENGVLDVYESLVDNNTSLPTDATKWQKVTVRNLVPNTRSVKTTAPLEGGGQLSADLELKLASGAEGDVLIFKNGAWAAGQMKIPAVYELCEFYYFRHPTLKPGFQAAQGGLLANAATLYPEAWAYLQTTEGQKLCKTEAQWQALTTATWATLADGTKVGWNGIGGAPFYAPNTATGALRLPDLRGMYAEAAGYDGLGVGGVHGDAVRDCAGYINFARQSYLHVATGVFTTADSADGVYGSVPSASNAYHAIRFALSRVLPTAAKNQGRAWGVLPCVYLGQPAS